jgi:hypothetical protein
VRATTVGEQVDARLLCLKTLLKSPQSLTYGIGGSQPPFLIGENNYIRCMSAPKKSKKKSAPKKRGKYSDKLAVKGSFMDIIGASVKNANKPKKRTK